MKTPCIVALKINGKWTVPHIGEDAVEAKQAFQDLRDAGQGESGFLFIRPAPEKRFKRDVLPVSDEPKASAKKGAK